MMVSQVVFQRDKAREMEVRLAFRRLVERRVKRIE